VKKFVDDMDPPMPKTTQIPADSIVYNIRSRILPCKIQLERILARFDREKSGTISVNQLLSAISQVGMSIAPYEIRALGELSGKPGVIRRCDLLEVDEEVKSESHWWERKPTSDLIMALRNMAKSADSHGISIQTELALLDRRDSGSLEWTAFRAVLKQLPCVLSDADVGLIGRWYSSQVTGLIFYKDFCHDLEEFGRDEACSSNRSLRLLKAALVATDTRLQELFADGDRSRLGTVQIRLLDRIWKPIKEFVGEEALTEIEEQFRDARQPEKFNYRRLSSAMASVRTDDADIAEIKRNHASVEKGRRKSVMKILSDEMK
jgi:Ca2+-binding EF-hand superfamily protein